MPQPQARTCQAPNRLRAASHLRHLHDTSGAQSMRVRQLLAKLCKQDERDSVLVRASPRPRSATLRADRSWHRCCPLPLSCAVPRQGSAPHTAITVHPPYVAGETDREERVRAHSCAPSDPPPQLRSACLGVLEAWARACSVASSARAPCAHAARASGTTELLPRYTSNSARPSETASMRRSGASCAHAHGVGREGTDAGRRRKRARFSQQKVS